MLHISLPTDAGYPSIYPPTHWATHRSTHHLFLLIHFLLIHFTVKRNKERVTRLLHNRIATSILRCWSDPAGFFGKIPSGFQRKKFINEKLFLDFPFPCDSFPPSILRCWSDPAGFFFWIFIKIFQMRKCFLIFIFLPRVCRWRCDDFNRSWRILWGFL